MALKTFRAHPADDIPITFPMPSNTSSKSIAILVAGMHRSGTSAMTRAFNLRGAAIGANLIGASHSNPAGHWENRDVVLAHDELLNQLDRPWFDPRPIPAGWIDSAAARITEDRIRHIVERDFADKPLWVVKDPRISRLLPLWLRILPTIDIQPAVVIAVRRPDEVAKSLSLRNSLTPSTSHLLWIRYNIDALQAANGYPHSIVTYDQFLDDWQTTTDTIARDLDLSWSPLTAEFREQIDAFVKPRLRHHRNGASERLPAPVEHLYDAICSHTRGMHRDDALRAACEQAELWSGPCLDTINDNRTQHRAQDQTITLLETIRHTGAHQQQQIDHVSTTVGKLEHLILDATTRLQEEIRTTAATHQQVLEALQLARDADRRYVAEQAGSRQLQQEKRQAEQRISDLENSWSWRLTTPLRAIGTVGLAAAPAAALLARPFTAAATLLRHPVRYARTIKEIGFRNTLLEARAFVAAGGPKPPVTPPPPGTRRAPPPFPLKRDSGTPTVILTTRHSEYVAKRFAQLLERAGIKSEIIHAMPENGYREVPHIVISPQMFQRLPGLYVSVQMEQTTSSRWFNRNYLDALERSYAVLDYSTRNIASLTKKGLHADQMFYVPVGPMAPTAMGVRNKEHEYHYDAVFYGDPGAPRRKAILEQLQREFRILVVSNDFGDRLREHLESAPIVLNIHYYDTSILETTRIFESLSLGKLVISEASIDTPDHDLVNPYIDYVEAGDVQAMARRLRFWLDNPDLRRARISGYLEAIPTISAHYDYYFYRFLLYSGNLSFEQFWDLSGNSVRLPGRKVCLALPEHIERLDAFVRQGMDDFHVFHGLRHPIPWVGCALSYKFISRLALKHDLESIAICEDDTHFPEDFPARWREIEDYLGGTLSEWDIFSGLMADIPEDIRVTRAGGNAPAGLLSVSRVVSMVFNVYGPRALGLLAGWDEHDTNVATNAIDRYLQQCEDLRILVSVPFLVEHRGDLYSTLWGFKNNTYDEMIARSEGLLTAKLAEDDQGGL